MKYFRPEEIDYKMMIKAAQVYVKVLEGHTNGTITLSQESIRYYCNSLLEIVFKLEEYANYLYDSLSDEEKAMLEDEEKKKNYPIYFNADGSKNSQPVIDVIENVLKTNNDRYEHIREEAKEKINQERKTGI